MAALKNHPSFIAFWCARGCASFGFQMMSVAVGWQMYAITGRAFDLGLVGLVQFVPSLVLALPAGHLADQFERRRIILYGQMVEVVAILALMALSFGHGLHETGLLMLVFMIGVAKAFEFPSMQSMLPTLVPSESLPRAMAATSAANQSATVMGPALGGVLYVAGPGVVYAVVGGLYLVSILLLSRLRSTRTPPTREPATMKALFAGVNFIRHRPDVLGVISLDLFAVLLGGATALLPVFAKDILHTGPWGLGLLRAAPAAGALSMSLWLARHMLKRHVGLTMYGAVAGFGLATILFSLSTTLWLSLAALFALGACDMVSVVIRGSLVQLDTPDAMRGRVSAVNAVFINTSNQLGEFESGMLAAWIGAMRAALVGGIGTLLIVGLWLWMFPTLRRRQRLQSETGAGGPNVR